ncbi:hypothetical protein GGR58DRAFT_519190 [Xylaria digitata]|nr:hypothetical protein GGR58DRAFT_519190 [Xylaria digitata]
MATQRAHYPEEFVEGSTTGIDNQGEILEHQESLLSSDENGNSFSIETVPPTDQQLSLGESLGSSGLLGVQATICTSMIAALMLEKYGAQKRHVAWLSVMRSLNDGPLKLGRILLSQRRRATLLQIESWLTFLVIAVTLALQFSSTLLLSDMNDFVILGNLNDTELGDLIRYTSDDSRVATIQKKFLTASPVYAAFGEVQASFDSTPDERGVCDTGLIQRSLLPLPGVDSRAAVRKFEGTTLVMSSQFSCIRPWIMTPNSLCSDGGCDELVDFVCPIPSICRGAGWQTISCIFNGVRGNRNGLRVWNPIWDPVDGPWSRNTTVALIITTNMDSHNWEGVVENTTLPAGKPYQEWQSYETDPGIFNITLCSYGFSIGRFHTSMFSPGPLREPQPKFDYISSIHNTTEIQSFMGVKSPQGNHVDRNILDLKILGPPQNPPEAFAPIQDDFGNLTVGKLTPILMEFYIYYQMSPFFFGGVTVIASCNFCNGYGEPVSHEISLLFGDTVAETGRAANALLSLITTIFTSIYYSFLGTLKITSGARVVAATTVRTPGPCSTNGCRGYVIVSTLVLLHIICVVTIAALYVAQVQYSHYGSVWHTIAQLRGDDLTDVLEDAHDASDAVVERVLKTQDKSEPLKVRRQRITGRVELRSD